MGDIADSIIKGEFNMLTGEHIGNSVGYPRTIYNEYSVKGKIKGIKQYLKRKQLPFEETINSYWNYLGYQPTHINNMCSKIQEDFHKFANWINKIYRV